MSGSVYIVSACRTPIGSFRGQFDNISIYELAKPALQGAIARASIQPTEIEEVYIGNVLSAGKGQNPAKYAANVAQIPLNVPATTLNMLCGSGLKAVALGYTSIKAGNSSVVLCAGMEHMSQAEHTIYLRAGIKLGEGSMKDSLLIDGLTDATCKVHMGITAEEVAKRYNVNRQDQDVFALNSQQKTQAAIEAGRFTEEIVAVSIPKVSEPILTDEFPRSNLKLDDLTKLRPAFQKPDGTVTPGNASGINDGAAALIVMHETKMKELNVKPLARIVGFAETCIDPMIMGVSPISAITKLLEKLQWTIEDVDLFEINEAFASQSIAILRELKLDASKVNVNGGAISLGHPIGASGARVLVTLIYALKQRNLKRGVCSLCIGGGMGIAMAIELC